MKTLRFQGMGCPSAESSKGEIENCRIRTAFHTVDGHRIFIEMGYINAPLPKKSCHGLVYSCYEITGDPDDESKHSLMRFFRDRVVIELPEKIWEYPQQMRTKISMSILRFAYTKAGILQIIRFLGGDFQDIYIDNNPNGYRAISPCGEYSYGDEYEERQKV